MLTVHTSIVTVLWVFSGFTGLPGGPCAGWIKDQWGDWGTAWLLPTVNSRLTLRLTKAREGLGISLSGNKIVYSFNSCVCCLCHLILAWNNSAHSVKGQGVKGQGLCSEIRSNFCTIISSNYINACMWYKNLLYSMKEIVELCIKPVDVTNLI